MSFKFLKTQDQNNNPTENRISENGRPSLYFRTNRNDISDEEMTYILRQQRNLLIERLWEEGVINQEIISQDDNGLTIRTELNL